jgi:octanoyl-[GcvH]:protein N-octanoyltransferase
MARLNLIRRSFPDEPELGTMVSRAILQRVAAGELPPTVRIHRPGRELAFGRQDVASPGYERAVEAAIAAGFPPVERLAGGRAAVFHEGTIAFTRVYPDPNPPRRTYERFEEVAGLVAGTLEDLGIDARVGEVPGEYCPGAYSVNAGGARKLSGIGQRMIRGGAHVGVVIVVSGADLVRDALVPVYEALGLEWDPATSGSVAGELGREVEVDDVVDALTARLDRDNVVTEAELDDDTLALARRMLEDSGR